MTSVNLLGGIDGITFEAFISQKLVPKLWKEACVLMDNYSIHKGEEVEKAIKAVGARVEAFSQVSGQDIRNWFTHCCYCTSST